MEEGMGNLEHNANAVTGLTGGVLAGTVLQTLYNGKGIVYRGIVLGAVNVDNGTDAAVVMLEGGIVKGRFSLLCHL